MTMPKHNLFLAPDPRAVVPWLLSAGLLALAVACGGDNKGDGGDSGPTASTMAGEEQPFSATVVTTYLSTGANRLGVGVIDEEAVTQPESVVSF